MAQPEHVAGAAELMARNDAILREANERIESYVQSMDERIDGVCRFSASALTYRPAWNASSYSSTSTFRSFPRFVTLLARRRTEARSTCAG